MTYASYSWLEVLLRRVRVFVVAGVLVAVSAAYVAWLKPAKPELRKYRIGEQSEGESGRGEEHLSSVVLADLGGFRISALELTQALEAIPPYQRHYYSTPEKVEVFLHNYAVLNLLAVEAAAKGLDKDPYVRFAIEEALAAAYKESWLSSAVRASDVSREEIAAWVQEHPEAVGAAAAGKDPTTAAKTAILAQRRAEAWRRHESELAATLSLP